MTLHEMLNDLANKGCYPGIVRRAEDVWRAYINIGGNYWHDDMSPHKAMKGAMENWKKNGSVIDGKGAAMKL